MKKGRYLICGLLAGCLLVPSVSLAAAKWAIGTSSSGSGPYKWGVGLASVVNKHQTAAIVLIINSAHDNSGNSTGQ